MAKNRIVNTKFWDDSYIIDLDPIEKLLFLYLLTNPLTNIAGIYEVQNRRIAFDTGIDKEMVEKILGRFERDGKIVRKGDWLFIKNFIKNQSLNPSVLSGIRKELSNLPIDFLEQLGDSLSQTPLSNLIKSNLTESNLKAKIGVWKKSS